MLMKLLWWVPQISAAWGAFYLINAMYGAESGPQQAAGAAVACALAVVPYVLVRSVEAELSWKDRVAALREEKARRAAAGS